VFACLIPLAECFSDRPAEVVRIVRGLYSNRHPAALVSSAYFSSVSPLTMMAGKLKPIEFSGQPKIGDHNTGDVSAVAKNSKA
jgi:hypothetical protein